MIERFNLNHKDTERFGLLAIQTWPMINLDRLADADSIPVFDDKQRVALGCSVQSNLSHVEHLKGRGSLFRYVSLTIDPGAHLSLKIFSELAWHIDAVSVIVCEGAQCDLLWCARSSGVSGLLVDVKVHSGASFNLDVRGVCQTGAKFLHQGPLLIPQNALGANLSHVVKVIKHEGAGLIQVAPVLNIEHDRVKAKHGIAIGSHAVPKVNYLQSRGVESSEALRILDEAHLCSALFVPENVSERLEFFQNEKI